jgi:hypothetical protein
VPSLVNWSRTIVDDLDPRNPVLVGVGQASERLGAPVRAVIGPNPNKADPALADQAQLIEPDLGKRRHRVRIDVRRHPTDRHTLRGTGPLVLGCSLTLMVFLIV